MSRRVWLVALWLYAVLAVADIALHLNADRLAGQNFLAPDNLALDRGGIIVEHCRLDLAHGYSARNGRVISEPIASSTLIVPSRTADTAATIGMSTL